MFTRPHYVHHRPRELMVSYAFNGSRGAASGRTHLTVCCEEARDQSHGIYGSGNTNTTGMYGSVLF